MAWEWILAGGLLWSALGAQPGGESGAQSAAQLAQAAQPAQQPAQPAQPAAQAAVTGELHTVATAHLDTQWRWTVRQTIEEFLPATLRQNFAFFDKYPDYVFNFEGAFRYMLMKEYYPAEYERLKQEVARGRWRVAGSWVDAVDTNIPSPESLIRHALYGNGYFRRELGVTSRDVFLPDCFGFGYALPSIAAHCGLIGFSTQKLTWGSAVGVPFDIGLWEGVDGARIYAAMDAGSYVGEIEGDWGADSTTLAIVKRQRERSGLGLAVRYFGTGDTGGAPTESSVVWLERSLRASGPVRVRTGSSDQFARDLAKLSPEARRRLPVYKGELLMTDHGAGCYTSQAAMKRWNRGNEQLADAAERASTIAHWLGGIAYPRAALRDAWVRFLWHQFHDDLTGTSIPEAYVYSWNDEAVSENRFAALLGDAAGAVCRALDTNTKGPAVVVMNPLSIEREDVVEARLDFPDGVPAAVRVYDADGREAPSQIRKIDARTLDVVFVAKVPSVGFAVFDARPAQEPCALATGVRGEGGTIENERYRVRVDGAGEIGSIFDKEVGEELLAGPIRLQGIADAPRDWPAWEVDYDDLMTPSFDFFDVAAVRLVENGPARAAIEVVRQAEGSSMRQLIRLAAGGAGDRLEVLTDLDWRTKGTLLKASFPLSVQNEKATYDLGLGTIERGVNRKELYEVPGQQWADLTDRNGSFGVAILSDCKVGWDRPDEGTLRLSLVRTPEVNERWQSVADQGSMDLGHHRFAYAVCGHPGDWRTGVVEEAARMNQPLRAFQAKKAWGPLGRSFSFLRVSSPAVLVSAVKLAEDSEEIVVRVRETRGAPAEARVELAAPILSAREVNGAEEPREDVPTKDLVQGDALVVRLRGYQPRTFALRVAEPATRLTVPASTPIDLPYDRAGFTRCNEANSVDLDGAGHSLPAELLPQQLDSDGIAFRMGPADGKSLVTCRGQAIDLPAGDHDQLYLLAASFGGDREATFQVDDRPLVPLWVQDCFLPVAAWDNRLQNGRLHEEPDEILPGYVKRDRIAWTGTHLHRGDGGREAYDFGQIYRYAIPLPKGARRLVLPREDRIAVFAASVARNPNETASPAWPPSDPPDASLVWVQAPDREFLDPVTVRLASPTRGATIRYTLDGSDPTEGSAVYTAPIRIPETTELRARAFHADFDDHYVATEKFTRLTLRAAVTVAAPKPGLACRYYEGRWREIPDFGTLTSARESGQERVGIPPYARSEEFGLVLRGYLRVPRDGLYKLHLWSDDGSALFIGDEKLIDNDGLHGRGEAAAGVALRAGFHPMRVQYFQAPGDAALELWIEGPQLPLQQVPPEMLFQD